EMSHSIQPSFSALNTSEKLDRQQSIYICCNVPNLLRHGRLPGACLKVCEAAPMPTSKSRHAHQADNHGLTGMATLQQM
ncbi:hypothetical protein ACIPZ5_26595, partial [Pseudomonas sp. NPDC089428]|uniref:hypothetical protein n=1 Tax=Pseudomonas sp. NPDC089428 TaxID=3364467 RepID=UPI00380F2403